MLRQNLTAGGLPSWKQWLLQVTFSVLEGAWNTSPVCCAQQFPHLLSHPPSQFLLDGVFAEAKKRKNTKNEVQEYTSEYKAYGATL